MRAARFALSGETISGAASLVASQNFRPGRRWRQDNNTRRRLHPSLKSVRCRADFGPRAAATAFPKRPFRFCEAGVCRGVDAERTRARTTANYHVVQKMHSVTRSVFISLQRLSPRNRKILLNDS